MDRSKTPVRPPSGIPRLTSKIPLPTSTPPRSVKPSPSRERLQADPGVKISRLRRPSQETLRRKPSTQFGLKHRGSTQTLQSFVESQESPENTDGETWDLADDRSGDYTPARPSLSDRTIDTLSRIPPSPSPRGRKSGFFPSDTSMGPPLRPASAMNDYSRSPSRSSQHQITMDEEASMPSPTVRRTPSRLSLMGVSSSRNSSAQRTTDKVKEPSAKPTNPTGRQSVGPESRRSIVGGTPSKRSETLPMRSALFSESKGLGTRAKSRPSLNNAFAKPSTQEAEFSPPLSVNKTRQPVSNYSSSLTSPSSTASKSSSIVSANSDQLPQHPESQIQKASKSSSALRESIAKAKAARKASRQSSVGPGGLDSLDNLDAQDPFNQTPKDSNRGLLLKRIEAARVSGSLNVAAMGLKVIPDEVMTMYDYDPNNNSEWYESVDLVKFIAADNELEQIPDIAFPDIDPQEFGLEDDCKGNQFGGLEILDLRGNMLRSLPIGLRRLQRLHSLNLSNNQLGMDDIDVVMEIESLLDLKLASNNLKGDMVSDLGRLRNLEVLDLRGNNLRALPETLSDLSSLKTLNVADNELKTLPFETLSSLPLMELNAARNKLQGTLIGQPVRHFRTLQTLNVAYNSLDKLTEADSFDFPNLQTLSINANRLKALPCVSTWRSLLRISAEDNNIAALPEGFLELDNLKHVDLTANDLTKLDERIGLMENLATFRIANNPLRERKFLTMDTDNLKEDLRNRCVPPAVETTENFGAEDDRENRIRDDGDEDEEEGSVATEFTLAPESPSHLNRWKVKSGGVLDRSATEMTELDVEELKPLLSTHDIRCLYIQRNNLQSFPVSALNLIATTLVDLDLSKNPLKTTDLFSDLIKLPHLQNLTVTAGGLTSLDPLFANCFAPSLKFLDVSANRLTGALPPARHTYPKLTTFLVADNQITSLRFDAVEGLQVLDVSNNNIDYLPPKIGLLGAEGSGPKLAGGPGLKRFEVTGNSFRVPRWQIVGKGTEAVLEWLKGRIPADELEAGDIVE